MISVLPFWIVALLAFAITLVYYIRYKNSVMSHWAIIALVFFLHFFFFAYGIIIFLITEVIKYKSKNNGEGVN